MGSSYRRILWLLYKYCWAYEYFKKCYVEMPRSGIVEHMEQLCPTYSTHWNPANNNNERNARHMHGFAHDMSGRSKSERTTFKKHIVWYLVLVLFSLIPHSAFQLAFELVEFENPPRARISDCFLSRRRRFRRC
jgi:hypothetical protein